MAEGKNYSGFAFLLAIIGLSIILGKSCVKKVKQYPDGSICARKIDHEADSWMPWLDTENVKDSAKMAEAVYKNEQADSADFSRILGNILFAKRYKFAKDDLLCFPHDLSGTYDAYNADVDVRLKNNHETVCKQDYEEDVMNFLKNRYPCPSVPSP